MDAHAPTIIEKLLGYIQIVMAYILTAVMMVLPAQPGNVTFSVSEPVTTESEKIIVEYKNDSRRTVYSSEDFDFILEIKSGNEWVIIPFSEDYYKIEIVSVTVPTLNSKMIINLNNAFGHTLEKGDYRLTFTYKLKTSLTEEEKPYTAQTSFIVS